MPSGNGPRWPIPQPPRVARVLGVLHVGDDRVQLRVADRGASRTRGMRYGPIRTASAISTGVARPSGGALRAGDDRRPRRRPDGTPRSASVNSWRPSATLPADGSGCGTGGPPPSECDVAHQRLALAVAELHLRALGLVVRVRQRHVAGPQCRSRRRARPTPRSGGPSPSMLARALGRPPGGATPRPSIAVAAWRSSPAKSWRPSSSRRVPRSSGRADDRRPARASAAASSAANAARRRARAAPRDDSRARVTTARTRT